MSPKKRWDYVFKLAHKVIKLETNNLDAYYYRSVANLALENYLDSINDIDKAIKIWPVNKRDFFVIFS